MAAYTVHEPPLRPADAGPDPARFVFVRDGFSFWAFVIAALWMLWHRMWLVLLIYVVVVGGVETGLRYAGASTGVIVVISLLISLLVGLEAATLRRFSLWRRGWRTVGVVSGHDLEEAERRFFNTWVRQAPPDRSAPPASSPNPRAPSPRSSQGAQAPDVIGLFPEPGASR